MQKNKLLSIISLLLVLILSSCAPEPSAVIYSTDQIAQIMLNTQESIPELQVMTDEMSIDYITDLYMLDSQSIMEASIYYSGEEAFEIAVISLASEDEAVEAQQHLEEYKIAREGSFAGYAPMQASVVSSGEIVQSENFIALIICGDAPAAKDAYLACFTSNPPPFTAVNLSATDERQAEIIPIEDNSYIYEPYEHDAIIEAWESGDSSNLSQKNLEILEVASAVIEEIISEDMSDFEKELAIHDWIILYVAYDKEVHDNSPSARPDPNNDNPFGSLINKKAICWGYTLTFELFMDMLGIECISVEGAAFDTKDEHAWNLVKLDNDWYAVDLTWNDSEETDGYGDEIDYTYFNITSQELIRSQHHWDRSSVPEAYGTRYSVS